MTSKVMERRNTKHDGNIDTFEKKILLGQNCTMVTEIIHCGRNEGPLIVSTRATGQVIYTQRYWCLKESVTFLFG